MSTWENRVDYNISESGVHPLIVNKLVEDPSFAEELLTTVLTYPQSNGIDKLCEHITALYPGATPTCSKPLDSCSEHEIKPRHGDTLHSHQMFGARARFVRIAIQPFRR